ncbi:MAG: Ca-activated chloride channel family protein [Glaciecola sp.]|jgi:Ca-activated chloride channel family protein
MTIFYLKGTFMSSLYRFVIVVSAFTVIGVIQALVPEFPATLRSVSSPFVSVPLTSAKQEGINNIGLNVIGTQNTANIQTQINIQHAKIIDMDPHSATHSGQLYFHSIEGVEVNSDDLDQSSPDFVLGESIQTEVKIAVTGMIARAKVTQTFTNQSNDWVNGLYVFPLPENAAVDHLMIEVGDRKIEGQIKEKKVAKKLFEQAKRDGKKASLVEQRRPNLFTNSLANIGPGETVRINIEYQQTLQYINDGYSLRFPLGITPRYAPSNSSFEQRETALLSQKTNGYGLSLPRPVMDNYSSMPSNENQSSGALSFSENISISVNLNAGTQLEQIESEHHAINTQANAKNEYVITLSDTEVQMRDFVLNWQPELGSKPSSAHFMQLVNGSEYGMIIIYPPLPDEQTILDREVIYVLDTSGSMSGAAILQAKQALAYAIDDLSTRDKFNIIEFNSRAELLWRNSRYADAENKTDAFDFVSGLTANGGTEMHQALSMALQSKSDPKLFKQILFITDGSVSNESRLMSLIENNLNGARLFTIGIGAAPNSYFMTEAAKSGKGSFTFIGDTQHVKQKMAALLNRINAPALTDIQLNLKGIQQYQQFEMYPDVIGDLYASEPLVITYKQPMIGTSKLTENQVNDTLLMGTYNNSPWTFTPKAIHTPSADISDDLPDQQVSSAMPAFEQQGRAKGINVLWAREKIAQLTRDKRNKKNDDNEIIQEITATALEHHMVSEYTSLIAVDLLPSADETAALEQNKYASKLPQTATNAQLSIFVGLLLFLLGLFLNKSSLIQCIKRN